MIITEQNKSISTATIFIAGSKKATRSDSLGRFKLQQISAGTYQVSVSVVGYAKLNENGIEDKTSPFLKLVLMSQRVGLRDVIISKHIPSKKEMKFFDRVFLGTSRNAKECKILNPEDVNFTVDKDKNILGASSDDFILIENQALGYLIKYSLVNFSY